MSFRKYFSKSSKKAGLVEAKFVYTPDSNWLDLGLHRAIPGHDFHIDPVQRAARNQRQVRYQRSKMLSATDLLNRQLPDHAQLFPLIDVKKYRENAPISLSTCTRESIDEICEYFPDTIQRKKGSAASVDVPPRGYRAPKLSRSSLPVCSSQTDPNDMVSFFSPSFQRRYPDNDFPEYGIDGCKSFGSTSIPSGLAHSVASGVLTQTGPKLQTAVFRCTLDFSPIESKLHISISRDQSHEGASYVNDKHAMFYAKLALFPGEFKKKRLTIPSDECKHGTGQPAEYRNLSCSEAQRLQLQVKIYVRRGIFKTSRFLYEWMINLNEADLRSPVVLLIGNPNVKYVL